MPSEIQNIVNLLSGVDSVLIVGIGTGQEVQALKTLNVSHIEGIDLSDKMLEVCKNNHPSVILHHQNFLDDFNLLKLKYDLIIC